MEYRSPDFPISKGSREISCTVSPDKNIYFWFSCSEEAIDAIEELISEGAIVLKPTVELVYLMDGIMPRNKKVAKKFRTYVEERWLPVVLNRA